MEALQPNGVRIGGKELPIGASFKKGVHEALKAYYNL